ncbi:MAG: hypothetical protein ACKO23_21540 [Gemmataceae bacterium]
MTTDALTELHKVWLPHVTDSGLHRLIELLERGSLLLNHGYFSHVMPRGCLATHIAWNHPSTCHLTTEAGIFWMKNVAGLNPATSHLVRAWDRLGIHDLTLRSELVKEFRNELRRRGGKIPSFVASGSD